MSDCVDVLPDHWASAGCVSTVAWTVTVRKWRLAAVVAAVANSIDRDLQRWWTPGARHLCRCAKTVKEKGKQ